MGLSTFPAGGPMWLYFGGVRGLWQLIMRVKRKERVKKGKERIEESGENVGGISLNYDREEWEAIEELKGAEHK
jgi:hypothetical protein